MQKVHILLAIIVVFGMFSCTKVGPMGPQGEPGQNGANGQNGEDGEDGTSPAVYYFDVPLNNFQYESYNESWNSYYYIEGLTINITDLVMVFVNLSNDGNGDNYWQALSYNEFINNTDFYIQHSFGIMDIDDDTGNNNYLKGDIMFSLRASDGFAPYDDMSSDALLLYNVYVIKGVEGKKAQLPDGLNPNNREDVKKYVSNLKNKN